ncbi:MAG: cytochrome P460 family protein, partial [Candidatus Dadabacteria bacterium]|nr:cytochrome P460 family protein [Candidatus Dadabacteria bacterium]
MKMKPAGIWVCLLCLFSLFASSCDDDNNRSADNPLPPDSSEWACESPPPPQADIDALCAAASDFGLPAPDHLRSPVPIDLLDEKNIYDMDMRDFLRERGYVHELDWLGDLTWRFTGPYVGPIGNGRSYGVHPAVKIYYSPEMMEWLCSGRQGEVPDGSMIVKEMHSINDGLQITMDSEGCMVINADVLPTSWTVMVKQNGASHDGWYWANYTEEADPEEYYWQSGNPPIFDRSAVTNIEFFGGMTVPVEPNPLWYPTGYLFESKTKLPDIVPAFSSYGNSCINCHASAESESTFISLDNILTPGLGYKHYDSAPVENPGDDSPHVPGKSIIVNSYTSPRADGEVDNYVSPFSLALKEPSPAFLEFYDQLAEIGFGEVWDLRLPAETYDHVFPGPGGADGFMTSDQCIACHDATLSNSSLPNMIFQEPGPDGTENINLSPYGEWKASPMGLAGRDPVFFSQLESETNHLPELTECIENTCLHCHGVMGQRQLAADTEGEFDDRCKDLF